jgi:chemotaxis-related protein WspB
MLLLLFQIEQERFGLDVTRVIEVTPLAVLKKAPAGAAHVAGLFNYRGSIVPVIDLSCLLQGRPSRPHLSTRIILVDYTGSDSAHHILGLMAERVTETVAFRKEDVRSPGIGFDSAPYLGDIIMDNQGMIQHVLVEQLLPRWLQESLFPAPKEQP